MVTVCDSVAEFPADVFQSDRFVSFHNRTGFQQAVNQDQRRSFANVICARFEAQPPDRNRAPGQVTAKVVKNSFMLMCLLNSPNDPHQRMAGEEYPCQAANDRHSAAWDWVRPSWA